MNLWNTRNQSLSALENSLRQEAQVIEEAFALIDECINRFQQISATSQFSRVCGLTLIKARNLALGCYSLCLDGLAQEAGAILRPLLETTELLAYFREGPSRVELAIDGKLPPAGKIAKTIESDFKDLRDYFNRHASHFGFSFESLRHVVNFRDFSWITAQSYDEHVLRTNLGTVFAFLVSVAFEGANCLSVAGSLDNNFADRIEHLRNKGLNIFQVGN